MRFRIWDNGSMGTARNLFSHTTIPWLLFLWSAAEILERVEFISNKFRDLRGFIVTPAGAVILLMLSVVWLSIVAFWPSIRVHFPNLRLPKTLHELVHTHNRQLLPDGPLYTKLAAVENSANAASNGLEGAVTLHNDFAKAQGKITDILSESIKELQQDRTQAIKERSALDTRITSERRALAARIDEHRDWISDLNKAFNAFG